MKRTLSELDELTHACAALHSRAAHLGDQLRRTNAGRDALAGGTDALARDTYEAAVTAGEATEEATAVSSEDAAKAAWLANLDSPMGRTGARPPTEAHVPSAGGARAVDEGPQPTRGRRRPHRAARSSGERSTSLMSDEKLMTSDQRRVLLYSALRAIGVDLGAVQHRYHCDSYLRGFGPFTASEVVEIERRSQPEPAHAGEGHVVPTAVGAEGQSAVHA